MIEKRADQPFRFHSTSLLVEIIGEKAHHLKEFVEILKKIDEASIFFHVHHAFREHSFIPSEYSNDFAHWIGEDLEESRLAERLAAVNIRDFKDLSSLRARLVEIIEEHLSQVTEIRMAPQGREFYFLRSTSIISPTEYEVWTLKEFAKALNKVGMRSLYFHFFDARLRLGHRNNDFSLWIENNLDNKDLAQRIESIDPYFVRMDQLREKIIALCKEEQKSIFDIKKISRLIKILTGKK